MSRKRRKPRAANKGTPKWKRFESLVGKLQQELAPDAKVTLDDRIIGRRSRTLRQIDISVRRTIGQFEILIVIDCKDYAKPVDVKDVEDFLGLAEDVGANKGALVSSSGFTEAAKTRAQDAGVDVYRLVDAEDHDWHSYVAIPFVCDFRGFSKYKFKIAGTNAILRELSQQDSRRIPIYNIKFEHIGTPLTLLWAMWNQQEISAEPGTYQILLKPEPIFAKSKHGSFVNIEIIGEFEVVQKLYFGEVPLTKITGFRDETTGHVVLPNNAEIITDFIDVRDVEKNWMRITSVESLAVKPFGILTAFDSYPSSLPEGAESPKISGA